MVVLAESRLLHTEQCEREAQAALPVALPLAEAKYFRRDHNTLLTGAKSYIINPLVAKHQARGCSHDTASETPMV